MSKPIRPGEVAKARQSMRVVPDAVYDAFNEMIVKKWDGTSATVLQKDVVALIVSKIEGQTAASVFENGWLDIEDDFRSAGWKVEYDKPGYCESYEPTFVFRKPKQGQR